jgi:hypothetical protein
MSALVQACDHSLHSLQADSVDKSITFLADICGDEELDAMVRQRWAQAPCCYIAILIVLWTLRSAMLGLLLLACQLIEMNIQASESAQHQNSAVFAAR